MRQHRSSQYRNINSLSKSVYNTVAQEDGPLFAAYTKLRDSATIQSFVVEWQMQTNDYKKFNEKLVKISGNGFYFR